MGKKIIQQGAEAVIYLKNGLVIKERVKKSYRIKELDEKLRKLRTRSEARIMDKLRGALLKIPKIIEVDEKNKKIVMEYVKGLKLSENLEKLNWKKICKKIGEMIAEIHDRDVIHGDLTTSNMILKGEEIYLIDFGLAFHSHKIEDKAVDLHLLKQALEAKHFTIAEQCIEIILKNYKPRRYKEILEQLKKVESRGRYKEKF